MSDESKKIGIVKMFNGTFGFINSIDGDIYFHKTGINPSYSDIAVKDKVEYDLEPSSKKVDMFQATNIKFVEKNISEEEINLTYRIGKVSWFDNEKGFGIACEGSQEQEYFFTRHSIKTKTLKIYKNDYVVFEITPSKKKINQFDAINVFILKNYSLTNSLQKLLINELEKLGFVDTDLGYSKLTIISDIYNLYNCVPPIEYIKLNDDFKYQYWSDGYDKQVNLGVVAGKLIEDKNKSNTYYDVLKKIIDKKEQEILLDNILNEIVNIENSDKYEVLKNFFNFTHIDDTVKTNFIKKVASKFDFSDDLDEYKKYQLWLYGYTNIECQEYIVNQIKKHNFIDSSSIFNRVKDENGQRELLNKIQNEIDFNDYDKYKILTNILKEKNVLFCVKEAFVSNILQTLDNYYSFKLWIDGYTEEIDLGEVSNSLNSFSHSWDTKKTYTEIHSKIFSKIKDEEKQITVLTNSFLKKCTNYERFLKLNCLVSDENISLNVKEKIKIKFLYNAEVSFKYWLWFNKFSHTFHNKYFKDKTIFYYINDNARKEIFTEIEIHFNNIINVFDAVNDGLIAEIDEYYRNNWDDFLEDYCEKYLSWLWVFEIQNSSKLFEIYVKISNGLNLFFIGNKMLEPLSDCPPSSSSSYLFHYLSNHRVSLKYNNVYFDKEHYDRKIALSKVIIDHIDTNKKFLLQNIEKFLIENRSDWYGVKRIIETINLYFNKQKIFISALNLNQIFFYSDVENIILRTLPNYIIIKLWLNDLIEKFDFNTYCFYYFTLNLEERKIFNKKAKAIMGNELKKSMLKQKEPWILIKKNDEEKTETYSATWKSIWFDERFIRICVDKEPRFSKPYRWDFSEEKFNLLFDYISGKRLEELKIKVIDGEISKIEGLDDLEEVIWKILIQKEAETGGTVKIKNVGTNRIPVNMIRRNQCIQFLNKLQVNEYNATMVLEKAFSINRSSNSVDVSILYSIPINQNEVAIIWESLELEKSKATHIFKCRNDEYLQIINEITNYLTEELLVRSSLNSKITEDKENKERLKYKCRIDHDNFNYFNWEKKLLELFPELTK